MFWYKCDLEKVKVSYFYNQIFIFVFIKIKSDSIFRAYDFWFFSNVDTFPHKDLAP